MALRESCNFVKKLSDRRKASAIIYLTVNRLTKVMGESKRRKTALGDKYGQEPTILPWLPVSKRQADEFMKWTTRGTWIGIGVLIVTWVTVVFIGPGLGWWHMN